MSREVQFEKLAPGSPYIIYEGGWDNPIIGIFKEYQKDGERTTAIFDRVEELNDNEQLGYENGRPFDPEETRFFLDLSHIMRVTNKKAVDQTVRHIYETKTGQDSAPGSGPADIIRKFMKATPPKNAMGGRRTRKHKRRARVTRTLRVRKTRRRV